MTYLARTLLVTIASAAWSTSAMASPAYLTCDFTLDGKPFPQSVTADEANARVSTTNASGNHEIFQAAFSANKVVFANKDYVYLINRTSLEAVRIAPAIKEVKTAKCSVEQAPAGRAF